MTSLSARATAAIPTSTFGGFAVKKRLTHQQIKLVAGVEYVFRVVSPTYPGHDTKPAEGEQVVSGVAPRKPPTLMQVIMLNDDNKLGVIVCPKGITDKFEEEYGDEGYVGRVFGLCILGKRVAKNGNNFNEIDFVELEAPDGFGAEDDDADAKPTKPSKKAKAA